MEMELSLGNSYSLSRIRLQMQSDKKIYGSESDLLVYGLDLLRLEWGTADNERVQDNTDGPGVHFEAVTICSIEEHLRSDIIRCAADGFFAFAGVLDQSSEPEIPDLDIHARIQKQISKFEVTMNDLVGVHIMASPYELYHKESDLGVGEATSTT